MYKNALQKADTFMRPLLDQRAKEGKDKKVVFDAGYTKPNCKCKWFFRKDVSVAPYKPWNLLATSFPE